MSALRRRVVGSLNDRLARRLRIRIVRLRPDQEAPAVLLRPPTAPTDRLVPDPVFLLSSVRSGSTLLRLILNSHSQLHAPHETHFRRAEVQLTTDPVRQAMAALDLNHYDLEHLLWDRVLHRELTRSGKSVLVEKTPSNVFVADRLALAWPQVRFVFLLRHPASIVQSWQEAVPERRTREQAIDHTLWYMRALERTRKRHDGLTLRYEDLTAEPERELRRVCEFLRVDWEPAMLDYGANDHGALMRGIGDWRAKIRTGAVQRGRALPAPDDVDERLVPFCRAWGY